MEYPMTPAQVTSALRAALDGDDLRLLLDLLAPDVTWAPTPGADPSKPGRSVVLTWYAALRERGIRTAVDEIFTYPDAVVLGLPAGEVTEPGLYQVFRITDGKITDVRGHTDRYQALDAAYRTC